MFFDYKNLLVYVLTCDVLCYIYMRISVVNVIFHGLNGWFVVCEEQTYFIVPRLFRNFHELKDNIWHFIGDFNHTISYLSIHTISFVI